MEKIQYELPSYNTNPDIPRELDKLVSALDQQLMTNVDKDDMELRFQEQLEEMRTYITTLSESNAIPTLHQLTTETTIHKYQLVNVGTIDNLEMVNINDFVGRPLNQTFVDDIGEYIQVGDFTFMIVGVVDQFTYSVVYTNEPYSNDLVIYDKTKIRDFDMLLKAGNTLPSYEQLTKNLNYVLYEEDSNVFIAIIVKSSNHTTSFIMLNSINVPLFAVFYSSIEKSFKMWDGNTFVDFGQTFIPQAETYTKDEIDLIIGANSTEVSKREYVFQSGSNVYIDRTDSENPVLNVLNFDALDKTKDAITSLTSQKKDDINGYQIILNTLSSAENGGFKISLPNVINDEFIEDLATLNNRLNDFDVMCTTIEDNLRKKIENDSKWILAYTGGTGTGHGGTIPTRIWGININDFEEIMVSPYEDGTNGTILYKYGNTSSYSGNKTQPTNSTTRDRFYTYEISAPDSSGNVSVIKSGWYDAVFNGNNSSLTASPIKSMYVRKKKV